MAKIGLKHFRYAILTENNGAATYGTVKTPAKAISCNVTITNNNAKLYADDVLVESDTSFQSGTATVGIDNDDLETMADFLGHTYSAANGIKRNANDIAPYVGFGRVVVRITNGVRNYKVEFLRKVKFSEPSEENSTKGEAVEFGTTTIEGTIATLENGDWSDAQVFPTEAAAITYLEGLFTPQTATTQNSTP